MSMSFFSKKNKPAMTGTRQKVDIDGNQPEQNGNQAVLVPECIRIGLKSVTKDEAIEMAGQLLVDSGYVRPEYIGAMKERETVLSTYIGDGVAIPHGVGTSRDQIIHSGICILQFPEGIEYTQGEKAYLVVGIAGKDNQHLKILSNLAEFIQEGDTLQQLFTTTDTERIFQAFTNRF
jgi:mannitol/fructose-specific phosphotransferase system IIA component